jgi:hypothetical protein
MGSLASQVRRVLILLRAQRTVWGKPRITTADIATHTFVRTVEKVVRHH